MESMMLGAIATACFCAGLFFLRFWKTTRDRFFLFFAAAFVIEGGNRIIQGLIQTQGEQDPLIYLIRLVAFLIILFAIVDKNWLRKRTPPSP